MLLTFRDTLRAKCPRWLQGGNAEKVLYAIGIQLDGLTEAVTAGVKLRFPGLYTDESLPQIGRDRRIRRGRAESAEIYATRLRRWLDDHPRRGGPYALLEQIHAYFATSPFAVSLVYFSGRTFDMDADGVITRGDITWAPDAEPERWARWWLFYEWPETIASDGLWVDAGVWDDGGVWDSDLTVEEVAELRDLPREWNAAHANGKLVLLSGGVELWDYPEGTWDEPGGIWGGSPVQLDIG